MSNITVREQQAKNMVSQKLKIINTIVNNNKAKASTYAGALVAMANDYNLRDCSVESIINVGFQIVQAGLNPNKLFGQAYVVPFDLKNGGKTAQLQIGYKGWISLGYRNGWKFKAVPVYKCDEFSIEFGGFEDIIEFKPNFEARNDDEFDWVHKNLVGVVVYAKDSQDDIFTEFVSFKKLEKLRLKSQTQNDKTKITAKSKKGFSLVWGDWTEELYRAKALKYVVTRLPINDSIMEAVISENEAHKVEEVPKVEDKKPTIDLNEIAKDEPIEIDVDVEDVAPDFKGELTKILLSKRVNPGIVRNKVLELTDQQAEKYLNDEGSLDALVEELQSEK